MKKNISFFVFLKFMFYIISIFNISSRGRNRQNMTETNIPDNYFDSLTVRYVNFYRNIHDSRPTVREHLRIGLMTGTEVQRITDSEAETIAAPFVFFRFRGQKNQWKVAPGASRNSFCFDLDGIRAPWIEATLRQDFPQGYLKITDPVPFQLILDDIHEMFYKPLPLKRYRLPLLAEKFIALIYSEHFLQQSRNKYERQIQADANQIFSAPERQYDFGHCAAALGITLVHYRRVFKTIIGLPPYEYLQKCRLGLAIRLLRTEKQLQIQQIAEKCGFGNATEFSRFFRKHTGSSPSAYFKKYSE